MQCSSYHAVFSSLTCSSVSLPSDLRRPPHPSLRPITIQLSLSALQWSTPDTTLVHLAEQVKGVVRGTQLALRNLNRIRGRRFQECDFLDLRQDAVHRNVVDTWCLIQFRIALIDLQDLFDLTRVDRSLPVEVR